MTTKQLVELIACKPLLTRKDLAVRYGVVLSTVDRWHARGVLPPPVYLRGSGIPMWRPCDIAAAETTKPSIVRALHHATRS